MTDRKITLKITTETPKSERIGALAAELDRLAAQGGKAGPKFKALAAEIRAMEAPAGRAHGVFGRLKQSFAGLLSEAGKLPAVLGKISGFFGLGGAGIAGGVIALAQNTATAAVEVGKLAQLSGAGAEEFQRYAAGAKSVGFSSEKMADVFKDVNDKVGDFLTTGGGPLQDFFATIAPRVGITAEAFRDLSGPQALQLYYSSLERANVSQAEMTFYMEAIASDSTALAPLLANNGQRFRELGDEAERFGAIMSDELIELSREYAANMARLQSAMQGVSLEVGGSVLPALNALAQSFLDAARDQGKLVDGDGIETWATRGARVVGFLVDVLDGAARTVEIVGIGIGATAAMAMEIAKGNVQEAKAIYEAFGRDVDAIMQRPQFSARVDANLAAEPERARTATEARRVKEAEGTTAKLESLERKLAAEQMRLHQLTSGSAEEAMRSTLKTNNEVTAEYVKNAETLKNALMKAWEGSREGARKAGEEAANLFQAAADAQGSRQKQAQDRRDKSLTPEEAESKNRNRATSLTDEASRQATFAQNAAIDGRAKDAQRYAEKALQLSKEAADYAGRVQDDGTAARLLEQIGSTEKAAIEAQARLKQQEKAEFEQTAEAQLTKIREIEAELAKIRQVQIDADTTAAQAAVVALQAQIDAIKDKTVTITVVQKGSVPDGATVSTEDAPKRAYGGPLPGVAKGIRSDNQLYWGTPGEWVMDIPTVRRYGEGFMRDLLAGRVPRYAYGGQIGGMSGGSMLHSVSMPSMPAPAAAAEPLVGSRWVLPDGREMPVMTTQDVHAEINRYLRLSTLARGSRR